MTKNEFIEGLKDALTGELPDAEILSNIRFYDDYIRSKSMNSSEEEVLLQLGDPRLIARTIIDTYQMSHGPIYNNSRHEKAYRDTQTSDGNTYRDYGGNYDNGRKFEFNINSPLKWYQKGILAVVASLVIILVFIIGGLFLKLFFTVGVPILLVYFGYKLISNNYKR